MKLEKIPEYTTVSEVARFTKMDAKTISKRAQNLDVKMIHGRNHFYDSLEIIRNTFLKASEHEKANLNLSQEKAMYYKRMSEKIEVEIEKMSDKYMLTDDVKILVENKMVKFKQVLLTIPTTLDRELAKETKPKEVKKILQNAIDEALLEMASIQDEIDGEEGEEEEEYDD